MYKKKFCVMLTTHPGEKEIQVKRKCIIRPNADDGNNCERKFSSVQGFANPTGTPVWVKVPH